MTAIDRTLLTFLCVGVWVLTAISLASSSAKADSQGLDRYDVRSIVENCDVSGDVSGDVYMHGEDYGTFDGELDYGRISC